MALYTNFNQLNEYMKIGSAKDSCYICAKKAGATSQRDAYDTMRAFQGKIENQKIVSIRKSGIDACICMNCIKEIYDEHIAPTLVVEEVKELPKEEPKEEIKEEPKEEVKETKQTSSKKNK